MTVGAFTNSGVSTSKMLNFTEYSVLTAVSSHFSDPQYGTTRLFKHAGALRLNVALRLLRVLVICSESYIPAVFINNPLIPKQDYILLISSMCNYVYSYTEIPHKNEL